MVYCEKLKKCIGIQELEATMVLIDPKSKPTDRNNEKIDKFCAKLTHDLDKGFE